MSNGRDHGGGLDAAVAAYGGTRAGWLDLSTGINPVPYPVGTFPQEAWTALPDRAAFDALNNAARRFWNVPEGAAILPAAGASALIARIPTLAKAGAVSVHGPTYNEHAASFAGLGWAVSSEGRDAQVVVHPNNPDGRVWQAADITAPLAIIDESFCDVMPEASLINLAAQPGRIVIRSFGKFWGLAGARLGFAIGDPALIAKLGEALGPWQVSGPALAIGAAALADKDWADATRARLASDSNRLDALMIGRGAKVVGGTSLFRLYEVDNAAKWQERLARGHVWSRIFPYSKTWLRLGLPAPDRWSQLEATQ